MVEISEPLALATGSRLRDALESDILTGVIAPGERLDEVSLAHRFQVSRTPIREALLQLASAGLIEIRHRRGAVVRDLGPQQIVAMFEVMAGLEGLAARLAAQRHGPEEAAELLACHEGCLAALGSGDTDAYYYANERFHQIIYRASHNLFLNEQCLALSRRLRPYRRLQLRAGDRAKTSFAEHGAVVDAILRGDGEQADHALRNHVAIQGQRFTDFIKALGGLSERRYQPAAE
ncbi:MAG: GntR family transcriptional regulator [Beijerinckiaceae bacterium]|nr:GntR family transcriptional regulator [Beijerinckiaceae bacterium]